MEGEEGHFRLIDSTKAWIVTDPNNPATERKRWKDWRVEDADYLPTNYDVILNCDDIDTSAHIHVQIDDNTDTELSIGNIKNWVTAGWIPSVSWLNGKAYAIIKRSGIWWGERWPTQPNDEEVFTGHGEARTLIRVPGSMFPDLDGMTFIASGTSSPVSTNTSDTIILTDRLHTSPSGSFTVSDGSTIIATGTIGSVLDGLALTSSGRIYAANSADLSSCDLLGYAENRIVRIPLATQSTPILEFQRQPEPIGGNVSIVEAQGRAWPGEKPEPRDIWYGGAASPHYTHSPTNTIYSNSDYSTVMLPAVTVTYPSGFSPLAGCDPVTVNAFDIDLWSQLDEHCSEADHCRSPDLYKTFRSLQNLVIGICHQFVPVDDYSGKKAIPTYTPATLFERINVNFIGRFRATADDEGNYAFIFPPQPSDPYWTILDSDGVAVAEGTGGSSGSLAFSGGQSGRIYTLVLALGWTRKAPLEFRYAYPRSTFIPSIKTSDLGIKQVVVPPPDAGPDAYQYPGTWVDRIASSSYKSYEPFGYAVDGAIYSSGNTQRLALAADNGTLTFDLSNIPFTENDTFTVTTRSSGVLLATGSWPFTDELFTGAEPGVEYALTVHANERHQTETLFALGVLARYVGDNWGDPAITPWTPTRADGPLDVTYFRNLWEGKFKPDLQDSYEAQKQGKIAYGSNRWIRVKDIDWWAAPVGNGVMRTESGTATGGTATTLTDTNKHYIPADSTTGIPLIIPYWNSIEGSRWIGMMLEVDIEVNDVDGHPQIITYHTPIIDHNLTTVTFEPIAAYIIPEIAATDTSPRKPAIQVPALIITEGTSYRIKEPNGRRNWWRGRTLRVTRENEQILERIITHNDREVLWIDESISIEPEDSFEIIELDIGSVYAWDGNEWLNPAKSSCDVPPSHLLPATRSLFGPMMAGDYVGKHIFQELYMAINALRWTKYDVGWTSRENINMAELNEWMPQQQAQGIGCVDYNDVTEHTWFGTGEPFTDIYGNPVLDDQGNPIISRGLVGCYLRDLRSESDNAAPYWSCGGHLFPTGSGIHGGARYAYGVTEAIPISFNRAVDFFAMGWIDSNNSDPQSDTIKRCYQTNDPWNNIFRSSEINTTTSRKYEDHLGLSFRTFTKYGTVAPNHIRRVISDRIGSNEPVPPVGEPNFFYELREHSACGDCCDDNGEGPCDNIIVCGHGYMEDEYIFLGSFAARNTAIARWDVAGGFTFVD